MQDSIKQRVKTILEKHVKLKPDQMEDDLPLENTAIDSLGMMEAIFDLEDAFNVEIPEPDTIEDRRNRFRTVGDLAVIVKSLVEQNERAA